ncbi:hypothetical protein MBANPS3_012574, partial [Mucor bainieri]
MAEEDKQKSTPTGETVDISKSRRIELYRKQHTSIKKSITAFEKNFNQQEIVVLIVPKKEEKVFIVPPLVLLTITPPAHPPTSNDLNTQSPDQNRESLNYSQINALAIQPSIRISFLCSAPINRDEVRSIAKHVYADQTKTTPKKIMWSAMIDASSSHEYKLSGWPSN